MSAEHRAAPPRPLPDARGRARPVRADPRAGARPDAAVVTDGTPGARAPVPALRARQVLALQRLAGNAAATAAVAGAPARTGP
ncbi:hypothetical protein, partial [Cellulomonas algicola]